MQKTKPENQLKNTLWQLKICQAIFIAWTALRGSNTLSTFSPRTAVIYLTGNIIAQCFSWHRTTQRNITLIELADTAPFRHEKISFGLRDAGDLIFMLAVLLPASYGSCIQDSMDSPPHINNPNKRYGLFSLDVLFSMTSYIYIQRNFRIREQLKEAALKKILRKLKSEHPTDIGNTSNDFYTSTDLESPLLNQAPLLRDDNDAKENKHYLMSNIFKATQCKPIKNIDAYHLAMSIVIGLIVGFTDGIGLLSLIEYKRAWVVYLFVLIGAASNGIATGHPQNQTPKESPDWLKVAMSNAGYKSNPWVDLLQGLAGNIATVTRLFQIIEAILNGRTDRHSAVIAGINTVKYHQQLWVILPTTVLLYYLSLTAKKINAETQIIVAIANDLVDIDSDPAGGRSDSDFSTGSVTNPLRGYLGNEGIEDQEHPRPPQDEPHQHAKPKNNGKPHSGAPPNTTQEEKQIEHPECTEGTSGVTRENEQHTPDDNETHSSLSSTEQMAKEAAERVVQACINQAISMYTKPKHTKNQQPAQPFLASTNII